MADVGFGGTNVTGSFTDVFAYVDGIGLPAGRLCANGGTYAMIVALYGYVSGRGAGRNVTMSLGSASVSFSVGAAGSAQGTGYLTTNNWLVNGGSARFRYDFNGSSYIARSTSGGSIYDSYGFSWTGVLGGAYRYYLPPTAPQTHTAATGTAAGTITVSWVAPSSNGDTAITGYQVQYSLSATFASGVTSIDLGVVLSHTITGLTQGALYYTRVYAKNAVTTAASTLSVASSTSSANAKFIGPKVWNGTTWTNGTVTVWNGTSWTAGTVKVWNGTSWVDPV